ncbi:hypothetical protein [Gorillibacterium sp. sgz5001074]|uniref:hypothetical protein n=1 Tax=Gorillibacterium sp. sgz5001074 TaxID=3446695 RepID=UPI003F67F753
MEKRLTRSDFVFILVFIFMLILALGAFFYGMKMGSDRTEVKYTELLKKYEEKSGGLTAYHQSYLVSFYHTVYLPFREFNTKWDDAQDEMAGQSADASSILKQLAKLADEKYESMVSQSMPETSPLLKEGHQNYLKSLKLFSQAASGMQSKANGLAPAVLMTEIEKNASFTEAKNFALQAQKQYYAAIVAWHQSMEEGARGMDSIKDPAALNFNDWNALNLNLKNASIASILASSRQFALFTPQDVTLRVDEMIKSGQAKRLNASTISQVMDILIGTHAVRPGDFVHGKSKYYPDDLLPQLPFFTKME